MLSINGGGDLHFFLPSPHISPAGQASLYGMDKNIDKKL